MIFLPIELASLLEAKLNETQEGQESPFIFKTSPIVGAYDTDYFTDENGNQVTDVNYFKDKGKMTFTGNINCYEGVNQVDLSSMDDVVYENTAN